MLSSFAATTSPPWPATCHGGDEAASRGRGRGHRRIGDGWGRQRVGSGSSELMECRHRCGPDRTKRCGQIKTAWIRRKGRRTKRIRNHPRDASGGSARRLRSGRRFGFQKPRWLTCCSGSCRAGRARGGGAPLSFFFALPVTEYCQAVPRRNDRPNPPTDSTGVTNSSGRSGKNGGEEGMDSYRAAGRRGCPWTCSRRRGAFRPC